VKVEYNLNG